MEKLDYGDLAKFLVSSGVALIVAGIGVVWLAYREPFDLLVARDTLEKITPLARQVLLDRQAATATAIATAPWFGGVLVAGGVSMIAVGIHRWIPHQRALDTQNELAGLKAERELRAMTSAEVLVKASTEAAESEAMGTTDASQASVATGTSPSSVDVDAFNRRVTRYLQTESAILEFLRTTSRTDYSVLPHQRLGRFTYDAVLRSNRRGTPHIVVEIKDLPGRASLRYVSQARILAEHAASIFSVIDSLKAIPVVLAVIDDDRLGELMSDERFKALVADRSNALVRFIPRSRLGVLDDADFVKIIDRKVPVDVMRLSTPDSAK
jgi:hypothetical protein